MRFAHLHVHSHYSLLDGLTKTNDLIGRVKELGMDSVALTDHGSLYGAIEFYQKAKKAGIKPIIGCEVYVAARAHTDKEAALDSKRFHLTLLAQTSEGYKNLVKLITKAHLQGFYYKPRVDHDLLRMYAKGLIALSGCLNGEIPQAITSSDFKKAKALVSEYQEIFGKDNFFLELAPHRNIPEQQIVNKALRELAEEFKVPVVATNDVHYCKPDDAEAQDILVSVQTGARFEDENRLTMRQDDFSIRSPEEMASFFTDIPEAIENTARIADSVTMEIELGKNKIPPFKTPNGEAEDQYLHTLCLAGIEKRYSIKQKDFESSEDPFVKTVRDRYRYEFEIIKTTGFINYFLVVSDFVNWAKQQNIIVGPGRGSAAGSLISYVLSITNLDPLKYNLLFERFLNPERVQMPDIDLDFADTRRDEVIDYVQEKYGKDRVAQIITFGTMAARAAIRDTGRALGMSYSFCDQIAKLIPFNPTQGMKEGWLIQCLETVQELKQLYENDPEAKRLIDAAMKLEGVARHASIHASGVVIGPEPLENFVPLQYATRAGGEEEVLVTQYDMHGVEALGLLKMDFLGLRNLSIIERALEILKKTRGIDIEIDALPLDDKPTYKLFQEGKTTGVFQFESSGIKRYLKELRPTELEDLIAMVALYRPGPMENIPSYINRKQGKEQVTYLHPKLEPILGSTYGIGVYQEQMMRIARDLAGFTIPEADTLRKAIGKKIKSLLEEQQDKLVSGMVKNGIKEETANAIWELFPAFARYGFVRAHAACYAMIAYQTGYLKTHFPAEYMAALMTAEGFEIERVAFLIDETKSMGIEVLAPDVNESFENFTVIDPRSSAEFISRETETLEGGGSEQKRASEGENPDQRGSPSEPSKIRFGLTAIKNVGSNIVDSIIKTRKADGPFLSLADFIERIPVKDLNRKSIEALAKCGALDELAERNEILFNMDLLLAYARDREKQNGGSQNSLFGGSSAPVSTIRLLHAEPAPKKEKLAWEKELLGLYITEHPLAEYIAQLKLKAIPIRGLGAESVRGRSVSIGGIVSEVKKILTKSGDPMLFVTLEDTTAKTEVLVFPSMLQKNPAIWQMDKLLLVSGKVSEKDGDPKILCDEVKELV